MIGIINYGSGNLSAFVNVYKSLNKKTIIINDPADLKGCSHIIMPGVSAWDTTMSSIKQFKDTLSEYVFIKKIPFLGVCVGMQILAETSQEGTVGGLGWINGNVRQLPTDYIQKDIHFLGPKLPHMGWNTLKINLDSPLMKGLPENSEFYFLHSYFFEAMDLMNVVGTTEFNGFRFPVIIQNENIFGVQFHPEKSHTNGINLLDNFSNL